ncbi:MAG: antibiotic biosynthesis monooxygenase [Magnetococcales bacterium]|nr:antibiotic biosynthesis monooxygenase [Magnetococcales bacterium]
MSIISVHATVFAKEGKEEEVKQHLLGLLGPTRAEKGCINYDLHQSTDPGKKGDFIFYENWENQECFNGHLNAPHVKEFLGKADDLLKEMVGISTWINIGK